ncbi:MAG: pilus assembly protein [Acidobacteriota bacterium]|nr:pilus assembly protein [Acidobacteriota bacterium]
MTWRNLLNNASSRQFGKCDSELGQSLIELSLVLPVLFAILIGIVELGRMAYVAIEVSNAANAGALYGSQNLFTAVDSTGMQNAAINDAADMARWTGNPVTATAAQSCTCTDGTVITCSNAGSKCITPARIQMNVQVNTQATVNLLFVYHDGRPMNYKLYGQAIMRVAQ